MQLKYLSASRIKTYEQCQLKYHAVYDLKYKEGPPHPLTVMGRAVHVNFDRGTEILLEGGEYDFLKMITPVCAECGVTRPNAELARTLTKNALDWGYLRKLDRCVGSEIAFFETLSDGETQIKGLIDRLDLNMPDGDIIDLKTQQKAFDDALLGDEWQTVVYNIAARRLHPDLTGSVAVSYWTLRHRVQRVWVSLDDAKRGEDKLLRVADEIRNCTDPQPTPTPLCQWCPYKAECPAANESRKSRFKRKFQ